MQKQQQNTQDSQLTQLEKDGPQAQAKRAVSLVSKTQNEQDSSLLKLQETYGSALVADLQAQHPEASLQDLTELLETFA